MAVSLMMDEQQSLSSSTFDMTYRKGNAGGGAGAIGRGRREAEIRKNTIGRRWTERVF